MIGPALGQETQAQAGPKRPRQSRSGVVSESDFSLTFDWQAPSQAAGLTRTLSPILYSDYRLNGPVSSYLGNPALPLHAFDSKIQREEDSKVEDDIQDVKMSWVTCQYNCHTNHLQPSGPGPGQACSKTMGSAAHAYSGGTMATRASCRDGAPPARRRSTSRPPAPAAYVPAAAASGGKQLHRRLDTVEEARITRCSLRLRHFPTQ